ncbi:MAG: EamA family transporter [Pseudomonadota bacterium]
MWIAVTLFAALVQSVRFVLQKKLRMGTLGTAAATLSRFFFAWPLLLTLALVYGAVEGLAMPSLGAAFWIYGIAGAMGQILGTLCTVALFQHRNFAVGATFKQTEVIQTVVLSVIILGEGVSLPAFAAILVGVVGVIALSESPDVSGDMRARVFNRATALGLGSGLLFGLASTGYRGAATAMEGGDIFLRSTFGLALLTLVQTAVLLTWLYAREPGQIRAMVSQWRVAGLVGVTSMVGSLGWFTAFGLQKAALVKALGQTELLFSFLFSTFLFGERSTLRELFGIGVLTLSVVLLILAT